MTVIAPAPERTHEQRMVALQAANDVRVYMAQRKKALYAGEIKLDELLDDPGCASMYVAHALKSVRRLGPYKTDRVLFKAGVSPSKRCGGLTARQRTAIIAHVGYFPAARGALL